MWAWRWCRCLCQIRHKCEKYVAVNVKNNNYVPTLIEEFFVEVIKLKTKSFLMIYLIFLPFFRSTTVINRENSLLYETPRTTYFVYR